MLAATVILGVLITVILAPLSQLFANTLENGQTLQLTTQAQEITEYVKGQWKTLPAEVTYIPDPEDPDKTIPNDSNVDARVASRDRYDKNCYDASGLRLASNVTYTIAVRELNRNAGVGNAVTPSTNCATAVAGANPTPMKRVTVTVRNNLNERQVLIVDIVRP